MKKSVELRKQLSELDKEIKGLLDSAKAESRNFTESEQTTFDSKYEEAEALKRSIEQAEKVEAFEARQAGNVGVTAPNVTKSKEAYSIIGHINAVRSGKLDGIFAEAQAEAVNELRSAGVAVNETANTVLIPASRSFAAGATTKGEALVGTEKVGLIESLFEGSLLQKAGAQYMTGLVGNVDMPKVGTFDDAVWADELEKVGKKSGTIGTVPLRPNRLSAPYVLSNQLLIQSTPSIDAVVRGEIQKKIQKALDERFVALMLASGEVKGVEMGANGGAIDYAKVMEFIQNVGESEADMSNAKFLLNYKIYSAVKQLAKGNTDNLVLVDGKLDGFDFIASNRIPSNLAKGTGTNLSAMLFGDFSSVVVGQWGGIALTVDPYTLADEGATKLTLNSYFDIKDRYENAKAVAKDIEA
ncbi:phage major capsid protein [Litoribacter alkaliphilus]|uniref:Phage major capsid protein n=1 Tax=Litoribacter ruber TaxID=702568 RepID=A0AAP2CJL6_9BACT|nr:phage major capsid protein [Litoribacter alkaliphilus]MBS9525918.1 phage major capsid protein [Litoribacter alkaliphilus]